MEDHDEDADEELEFLQRVQVFAKLGQEKNEGKGVSSQERERGNATSNTTRRGYCMVEP